MERELPYDPRITHKPGLMGGRPTIRGMRITAGVVLGLLASAATTAEILDAYPLLEADDIPAVLSYAAWRIQESEEPLPA
jgi:uncharacterized protein (DUF433 family)